MRRHLPFVIAVIGACGSRAPDGPRFQIVGESTRLRLGDPLPTTSPWFDGTTVTLAAARGEILGIQVVDLDGGAASLAIEGATVRGFTVDALVVVHPST